MSSTEDSSIGTWRTFLLALQDAEARSTESPYGARAVEDVACDPVRMEVSHEVRRSKAYLRATRKELKVRTEALQRAISKFDEAEES